MAVKKTDEKDLTLDTQNVSNEVLSNAEKTEDPKVEITVEAKSGITEQELEALLDNQKKLLKEEFQNMMKAEIQKVKLSSSKKELDDSFEDGEDLLDDWNEIPTTFFSYSVRYSLLSDMRRGKESIAPLGTINFNPLIRRKVRTDRGVITTSICVAKSNSKKEINWLRTSPLFGVAFHESISGTSTVDSSFAQILISANQEVNKLNEHSIITKCKAYGLELSSDVQLMRKNLINHIAKMKKASSDLYYEKQKLQMSEMTESSDGKLQTVIEKNL